MRKRTQIGQLTALPQNQKDLLEEWLETTTPYPQLAQRVLDEFGVKTNKSQLIRMRADFHAKRVELEAAQNLETIGELMDQGALANIEYKPVTLKLVEKRLFEHALDPNTDTKVLKNLYSIIDHHERRQLESRRLDLRQREVTLKEKLGRADASPEQSPKDPTHKNPWEMNEEEKAAWFKSINKVKSEEAIERDWLKVGMDRKIYRQYLAAIPNPTTEDREAAQRACIIRPKNESTSSNAETAPGACSSVPASPKASEPSSSVTNVQPTAAESPEGNVQPETSSSLSLTKGPLSAEQTSLDGHLTCGGVGNSLGQGEGSLLHSDFCNLHSNEGSPQSQIQNPKSKIEASVRDHLTRRALEWQRNGKNIRPTIYRECPCGKRTPCPTHGTFPEAFWHFSPWSADLADILVQKGLPWFCISLESKESHEHLKA